MLRNVKLAEQNPVPAREQKRSDEASDSGRPELAFPCDDATAGRAQRPVDRRQTAAFSINGQPDVLNTQLLDGADNYERLIRTIGVRPAVEGIAEVQIETNTYSAEAGRTAGGVVNVITKSGTNDFHGSVFEVVRNDLFDASANNLTGAALPKSELRQNDYGASLGGPIVKNKRFLCGDYEGLRIIQGPRK